MAAWAFWRFPRQSVTAKLVDLCWLSALLNLAANVLLTGTHERYLYHFFPQALIALLYWNRARSLLVPALPAVFLASSVYYGGYVYVILNNLWAEPGAYTWFRYQNMAWFFAALLVVFTVVTPGLLRARVPGPTTPGVSAAGDRRRSVHALAGVATGPAAAANDLR